MNRNNASSKINQSITKFNPVTQVNPENQTKPHASILADTAQTTPPTYPFPAYAIVKERSPKFSAAISANIKGTVSGTFVPTSIAARSGFYASPRAYVNALSHADGFFKNPISGRAFSKIVFRAAAKSSIFH
jgi:hypothetical protein